ncbi:MAG TPA: efflux RND transporter periplasmic adaptor subunit, partial [Caulobacteraceae bacterium]|nr:efflux RND transporter periplasmic adaptor subunit [Caulobacteraceae bacterium]
GGAGAAGRAPSVVGVATASLGDIPLQLSELGTVTPQATVTVQSQINGTLIAVYFREGQAVRKGQLLALVDPRPYEVSLQQAEGQLMRDQASLDEAKLDAARYRTLVAQDSIARQTYDQEVATVKQDEGVVRIDLAAIASARLNIAYCHIVAPVSGRVGLREVDPGNLVNTNEPNGLVVINELDPATVILTLPEDSIPQVAQRMAAAGGLPATAYDRTAATVLAQGELYTLDNQIDTSTGTVKARARFANPSGTLFPNQFVNVTLLVDTLTNVVTVPAVAIRHGPQGDFVYVIQSDSTVKVTPVKVGPAQGETASIQSGLNAGDVVVTDGGDRLSDGAHVIQPKDAARFAQTMARQRKPTGGILGWIEGLFGVKPAPAAGAGAGQTADNTGGAQSGAGGEGAARRAALLASLDLTADQQAKANQIFADARTKSEAAGDDFQARRQIMQDANNQLEAILTPEQKAKFEAGRAQLRPGGAGSSAPSSSQPPSVPPPAAAASSARHTGRAEATAASGQSPSVAAPAAPSPGGPGGPGGRARFIDALGLDAAQKAQADQIFAAARAQSQGSTDPDARRAAMRQAFEKLDAILRPDQKAKLAALRAQARGSGNGGG